MPRSTTLTRVIKMVTRSVIIGNLCALDDADLIAAALRCARANADELRGDGITRRPWGWDTFPPQQYAELFRFKSADDIQHLMDELDFPGDEYWRLPNGNFTREEAMLLFLRRLSYPATYLHLSREGFSAQRGALSQLYNKVGEWMFVNHTHRLLRTGMSKWAGRVPEYSRRVGDYTGFPTFNVFGFLDGTSRAIGRPGFWQRAFYSGHKRRHCLQFLSVTGPDGMILFTHGPTNGSHQDNWLVNDCKLNEQLKHLNDILGDARHPFAIYGDPIFAHTAYIRKAMPRYERTLEHEIFNKAMNAARVSIEHVFGIVVSLWAYVDFSKKQNLSWTNPATAYLNAQFLTNCHNCMYGNQVSNCFQIDPPTLHEYIHTLREEPEGPDVNDDIENR